MDLWFTKEIGIMELKADKDSTFTMNNKIITEIGLMIESMVLVLICLKVDLIKVDGSQDKEREREA